jgi:hypothetical protein
MGDRGLAFYHAWAFGTVRQIGAASELASVCLDWLAAETGRALQPAAAAFRQIASLNKTLILKAARAVNGRRQLDAAALFDEMSQAWDRGMETLCRRLEL